MKLRKMCKICLLVAGLSLSLDVCQVLGVEIFYNHPEVRAVANWTFMVYLDADNNLEGAGIGDFLEMSSVGSDPNVNIVVQFDRISGYNKSFGNWTIAHRFLITPGMIPTEANAISDWGDGSGGREVNMAAPQTLIDFVVWAMNNYPATNYAVILWNHGGGWREETALAKPVYKAVCWDDTSGGDSLYTSEVKDALSAIEAASGRIDLLGFDACLMGMLEVAYEIKDTADVMVGSEEVEPGHGWPYDTILLDLVALPTMTAEDLGASIVTRCGENYGVNSDATQSAIDLSVIDSLAATTSDFAVALMDSDHLEIETARSMSQEYYYPEHIDLYHFAELVSTLVSDPNAQNAALDVMTEVENAVFAEFHGILLPNSHGLAIYFPKTEYAFDPDYDGSVIVFPAGTQWDEFLHWYYDEFLTSGPNLYCWDGDSYEKVGFIFPGATPRENEYINHVRLHSLVPKADEQYYLQIRETEPEKSFIDMAKLIIIDHNSSVDINDIFTYEGWYENYVPDDTSKERSRKIVVLSPTSAVHSVIGNVRPRLRRSDDRYARMRPGDTITLTFQSIPLHDGERNFIFVGEGFYVGLRKL